MNMPGSPAKERRARSHPSAHGVAAVERAIAVVVAIAERTQPTRLADLARATGFYKSTLLRLVGTLERSGLVTRRPDGRYALGPFAHRLGRAYEATYKLTETVLPILWRLVDQGTESASFHVPHDAATRLCVLRVDSHHSTLDRVHVGDVLPLNRGAPGKALLAFADAAHQPSTCVFVSRGERDPRCAAVSCPVFGPSGAVYGAISLSGPKGRFTPSAIQRMSKVLWAAALEATQTLGGDLPTGIDSKSAVAPAEASAAAVARRSLSAAPSTPPHRRRGRRAGARAPRSPRRAQTQ